MPPACRWQLALLAALTGVLLRHTAFFCTNALLLGGYQLLHRAACRMLPGAARWMSAEGSAQAAPQAAAAALCWRYQASSALLSAAAVGLHLYLSERQRRRDFAEKRRRRAGGQVAGPSAARALQGSRRGGAVPAAAAAGNEPVWCRQLAGEEEFALLLAVAPLLLVALCFFL